MTDSYLLSEILTIEFHIIPKKISDRSLRNGVSNEFIERWLAYRLNRDKLIIIDGSG